MDENNGVELIRILVCNKCHTIEELPPYDGPRDPDTGQYEDPMLDRVNMEHNKYHEWRLEYFELFEFDSRLWANPDTRKDALKLAGKKSSGGTTGFEPELYATVNTFEHDAMRCFAQHGRPDTDCHDWLDDSKLLTPSSWKSENLLGELSSAERSAVRDLKDSRHKVFLCHYCPVSAYYNTRARMEKGMYK